MTKRFRHQIFQRLIKPKSQHIELRRQERILNILLFALLIVSCIAVSVSGISTLISPTDYQENGILTSILFLMLIIGLFRLSHKGHIRLAALGLVGLLSLAALQLGLAWGIDLQQSLLLFVLVIVVAGVTMSARSGLFCALGVIMSLLLIGYMQDAGKIVPDRTWVSIDLIFGDAVGFSLTLTIIALVCWLSNREIDRSLKRARASEAALAKERDNLEIKVQERTSQLEQEQLIRVMELRRFAEFGRLSANLLHEVANPLTAASINLEQLDSQQHSNLVLQARKNLRQLERYVEAARKQIKGQGEVSHFSVRREVSQLLRILQPTADKQRVKLSITIKGTPRLTGDPVKFSQLLGNLLLNAIEAYKDIDRPADAKQVIVDIAQDASGLTLIVHDWGKGIRHNEITKIFEPFYSTKSDTQRSMGIGLFMVKQFIEDDFRGSVRVTSDKNGTIFAILLRSSK